MKNNGDFGFPRNHAPMIVVGSDDASSSSGGKVQIQEYNEASRFVILAWC